MRMIAIVLAVLVRPSGILSIGIRMLVPGFVRIVVHRSHCQHESRFVTFRGQ